MPYKPRDTETIARDLDTDRAAVLAQGFAANGRTAAYILTTDEEHERTAVYVRDFPIGANLAAIATPIGALLIHSAPLPLGAALDVLEARPDAADLCLIHWYAEAGLFRVATYNRAAIDAIKPPISTFYRPADAGRATLARPS